MTISFWLNITSKYSSWRNIFHVSNQNINGGSIGTRVPGLWICPNNLQLYFVNDISTQANTGPPCGTSNILNKNSFITIVLNSNTITIYANAESQQTWSTTDTLVSAESDAKFYISHPWAASTGYQIKDFSLYDSALSSNDVKMIYMEAQNES